MTSAVLSPSILISCSSLCWRPQAAAVSDLTGNEVRRIERKKGWGEETILGGRGKRWFGDTTSGAFPKNKFRRYQ